MQNGVSSLCLDLDPANRKTLLENEIVVFNLFSPPWTSDFQCTFLNVKALTVPPDSDQILQSRDLNLHFRPGFSLLGWQVH